MSGRRRLYEKFPGLGAENVRGVSLDCSVLFRSMKSRCCGTGPPRFENVLSRFDVNRRGVGTLGKMFRLGAGVPGRFVGFSLGVGISR